IVLGVRRAQQSGLSEPARRLFEVVRRAAAFGVEDAEVVHRLAVARRGGALGPPPRRDDVDIHTLAALVELGQTILRRRQAVFGGRSNKARAFGQLALIDARDAELELGDGIAPHGGLLERRPRRLGRGIRGQGRGLDRRRRPFAFGVAGGRDVRRRRGDVGGDAALGGNAGQRRATTLLGDGGRRRRLRRGGRRARVQAVE